MAKEEEKKHLAHSALHVARRRERKEDVEVKASKVHPSGTRVAKFNAASSGQMRIKGINELCLESKKCNYGMSKTYRDIKNTY